MGAHLHLLVVTCLLTLVTTGDGLHCYTCTRYDDLSCGDPFSSSSAYPHNCDLGPYDLRRAPQPSPFDLVLQGDSTPQGRDFRIDYQCLKLVWTNSSGVRHTLRRCSSLGDDACSQLGSVTQGVHFCGICEEQLCNSASRGAVGLLLVILLGVLSGVNQWT